MRIAVLAFGSVVNHSHSEVYGATLEVKKPKEGRHLPPHSYIQDESPFIPADELKLPIRLGRISS